jgi:hypothetical protein
MIESAFVKRLADQVSVETEGRRISSHTRAVRCR